jgi:hypothetical protein
MKLKKNSVWEENYKLNNSINDPTFLNNNTENVNSKSYENILCLNYNS